MDEGRIQSSGHVIPIATSVADATYCFQGQGTRQQKRKGLTLLTAGRERCLPDFHVSYNDYPCLLIEFVVSGKGKLRVDDETFNLYPGIIFSYGMDSSHDLWADPKDPMTKYFAAFRKPLPEASKSSFGISQGEIRWTRDLTAVQTLFDELIREGQRSGKLHEEITARYLEIILLKGAEAIRPSSGQRGGATVSYEMILSIIESKFTEIASLSDLSSLTEIEPNHICRLFRKFGNETPIQSLTRHKLNRAAELLLTRSTSVAEISSKVGYDDPYYFSRVFKKRFGCSPQQFRKRANNTAIL